LATHVTLLSIPNVSEGREAVTIEEIAGAFSSRAGGTRLLDVHTDPDHHRTVFTLAGEPGVLAHSVLAGAREALEHVDLSQHDGIHPRVGVLDVAPIVYLEPADRGAACAEALVLGDLLGAELELPVFLYGELAAGRTRAELRRGGPEALAKRIADGELRPDFGPAELDPRRGATLVAARPPLVAFNLVLAPGTTLEAARAIAALIRESGPEGLPGVRAIGLQLDRAGITQISTNIEDHIATPLAAVVEAVARHAEVEAAEIVGVPPRVAFEGFPDALAVRNKQILEDVLGSTD
jgi:glutamate formiminotransferase/glutamate formiminotransferase/formiminotetrahydrofolate cyclodeaminase